MKKKRLLPPYLQWRDGRPRWEPGPTVRAKGFKGQDLKGKGQWLGLEAAIAAAKDLNKAVAGGPAPAASRPKVNPKPARTCDHLYQIYASPSEPEKASKRWRELASTTQRDYASKLRLFLSEFGADQVAALTKADLYTWWEEIERERGLAMATGTLACVRLMLSYAEMKGWITVNPARRLGLSKPAPRVVVWTPAEVEAFVAKADALELHGVADAVVIALHTGQRRGDTLSFEWISADGGRARFRQSKTGARVSVPYTPPLAERIDAIKSRRRAGQVAELQLAGTLVRDPNGRPYTYEDFGRDFRAARTAVAEDQLAARANEASIAGKLFLDLRDTAITRLALAGCTVAEIRAISGHSLETIHQVLAHYLALDDRMADAAIDKLKIWMAAEGIAI